MGGQEGVHDKVWTGVDVASAGYLHNYSFGSFDVAVVVVV